MMHGKTVESQSGTFRSYVSATLKEAFLHVQFAKPLQEIPRHVRYSWPRFKIYSKQWQYTGDDVELHWRDIREGSVPDAMMVSHRLVKEAPWYSRKLTPDYTLERSAFLKGIQIRHNLSDRNVDYMSDGDLSKSLLFHTKRGFPDYPVIAPNHKHGQIFGITRSDL